VSDSGLAPHRREFWVWVWSSIRPVFGWILAALGALALFLGWYGVSGEALTAKQLPYLVSGGLTGIALVIIAGVVLATEDIRRQLSRVDDLERARPQRRRLPQPPARSSRCRPARRTTGRTARW
jgi:predicted membrane metal-binding protein